MYTVRYIHNYLNQLQQNNFDSTIREQRKKEKQIVSETNSKCDFEKFTGRSIYGHQIEQALKNGWGDSTILQSLLCMNNASLYTTDSTGKVRSFIQSLSTMTAPSSQGIVLNPRIVENGNFANTQIYVVKTTNIKSENENLIHEYFVGAFGTNMLRSQIPNFAFIMGYFQCSPPFIDKQTQEVLTYCQNDKSVNPYIIYENVQNSVPFSDFIQTCSFDILLNILCQVLLSITIANKEIDFTHYDLHCNNVLIKTLPTQIIIPYLINNKTYYVQTQNVATIIDYGQSHIKFGGKDFGYDCSYIGRFPTRSHIMADVFKFLSFTLQGLITKDLGTFIHTPVCNDDDINLKTYGTQSVTQYKMLSQTLLFFNKRLNLNQTIAYLHDLVGDRFTLPYVESDKTTPLDFLNQTVFKMFPDVVRTFLKVDEISDRTILYGCKNNNTCLEFEQVIQTYTSSKQEPTNLDEKIRMIEQMCEQMYPITLIKGEIEKENIYTCRTTVTNFVKYIDMATSLRNVERLAGQVNSENKAIKHANELVRKIQNYVKYLKTMPGQVKDDIIKSNSDSRWFFANAGWLEGAVKMIN